MIRRGLGMAMAAGFIGVGCVSPAPLPKQLYARKKLSKSVNKGVLEHLVRKVDLGENTPPTGVVIEVRGPNTRTYASGLPLRHGRVYYSKDEWAKRFTASFNALCEEAERGEAQLVGAAPGPMYLVDPWTGGGGNYYRRATDGLDTQVPTAKPGLTYKDLATRAQVIKGILDWAGKQRFDDLLALLKAPASPEFMPPPGFGFEIQGYHQVSIMRSQYYGGYVNLGLPDSLYADRVQAALRALIAEDALGARTKRLKASHEDYASIENTDAEPSHPHVPAITSVWVRGPASEWELRIPTAISDEFPTEAAMKKGAEDAVQSNRAKVLADLARLNRVPAPPQ